MTSRGVICHPWNESSRILTVFAKITTIQCFARPGRAVKHPSDKIIKGCCLLPPPIKIRVYWLFSTMLGLFWKRKRKQRLAPVGHLLVFDSLTRQWWVKSSSFFYETKIQHKFFRHAKSSFHDIFWLKNTTTVNQIYLLILKLMTLEIL